MPNQFNCVKKMIMKYAIGADLGGTNFRAAAISEKGTISHRVKVPSGASIGRKHVTNLIISHINEIKEKLKGGDHSVVGVGIGIPGIVNSDQGIVYQSPHFPDWRKFDVRSVLEKGIGGKICVDNDVNMVALGEMWKGAGKGHKNFVMLTLGTGIGGGVIIDNKIHHGDSGFAGEMGHIIIERNGPRCNCGGKGCLEMYASATGIRLMIEKSKNELPKKKFLKRFNIADESRITVKDVHQAALDGDIFAATLFKKVGAYLGIGIASLVSALGIETIVIGGGVSKAWDFFILEAKNEIKKRIFGETAKRIKLLKAELGDDAGILGSATRSLLP